LRGVFVEIPPNFNINIYYLNKIIKKQKIFTKNCLQNDKKVVQYCVEIIIGESSNVKTDL